MRKRKPKKETAVPGEELAALIVVFIAGLLAVLTGPSIIQ